VEGLLGQLGGMHVIKYLAGKNQFCYRVNASHTYQTAGAKLAYLKKKVIGLDFFQSRSGEIDHGVKPYTEGHVYQRELAAKRDLKKVYGIFHHFVARLLRGNDS